MAMTDAKAPARWPSWVPYVVPMVLFLAITSFFEKDDANYPMVYLAKVALVTGALIFFRSTWKDLKFDSKLILPSVIVGAVGFGLWIGLAKLPYPPIEFLGTRTAYNPYEKITDEGMRMAFIATRFFGLALMVPLMEEIFWRSFMMRFASRPDFEALKPGEFTWQGFAIVAAFFGFTHPEWLPAVVYAVLIGLLLWRTKSVFACFVAHLVTNLILGIYVVTQSQWQLW